MLEVLVRVEKFVFCVFCCLPVAHEMGLLFLAHLCLGTSQCGMSGTFVVRECLFGGHIVGSLWAGRVVHLSQHEDAMVFVLLLALPFARLHRGQGKCNDARWWSLHNLGVKFCNRLAERHGIDWPCAKWIARMDGKCSGEVVAAVLCEDFQCCAHRGAALCCECVDCSLITFANDRAID